MRYKTKIKVQVDTLKVGDGITINGYNMEVSEVEKKDDHVVSFTWLVDLVRMENKVKDVEIEEVKEIIEDDK